MARLSLFVSIGLALSALPPALAGPACAKKNYKAADCVSKCQTKWGWTGAMMNTDPWGSVVKKTDTENNWDSTIAKACGVAVTSATASATAPSTASTETAIPAPAAAAGADPTLQSSPESPVSSTLSSTSTSALATSSSTSSTSTSSKASVTSVSVQTQGFLAGTRSGFVTSTIARPATTNEAVAQKPSPTSQPKPTTAAAAAANTPAPESSSSGTSSADIQAYLEAHNSIRAQHGASPLTWSDNAASKAQQWANGCIFKHSGGTLGPFGENLAAGTGSSYGIAAAVKSWTDEVSQYNPSNPVASHFTQVVWKGTSQVGCAVQTCSGIFPSSFGPAQFFVCEYSAQGNIVGEFAQNVQV